MKGRRIEHTDELHWQQTHTKPVPAKSTPELVQQPLMALVRRALKEAWRTVRQDSKTVLSSFLQKSKALDEWRSLQRPGPSATKLAAAEQEAAATFFAEAADFRSRLEAEAANLLVADNTTTEQQGEFIYYQRHNADGFLLFCRKSCTETHGSEGEEVLLDSSRLSSETNYADVTTCKVSDDHSLLAYIVDLHGDDSFELRLRWLSPDADVEEACIPHIRSLEFLGQSELEMRLLAVQVDPESKRAYQAVQLTVNHTGTTTCKKLWQEDDAAAYLELYRTKDRAYIFVSSNTKDTSEVRTAKCGNLPDLSLKPLLQKTAGVEYFAEHLEGWFYIISNHERADFQVYRAAANQIERSKGEWTCLRPFFTPPGNMHITDADLLSRWLVLYGHSAAAPEVCVVPLASDSNGKLKSYLASLPSQIGSVEPSVNAQSNANTVRYTFRSPAEPGCTYELDLASRQAHLVSRCQVDDPQFFGSLHCDRLEFPARDGTAVPLTLVRPHSNTPAPCLLSVYGSYGTCFAPDFRAEHVALLRRGWTLAWAHVRGGGENGRQWHSDGRQLLKSNSVLDLIDAMKFVLARGIATPGALCLKGSSAGGLTVGAVLNSGSDASLLGAAILEVPFVDTLTSMMDSTLPLTVHEFEEWGDPQDLEHEANIRSLSPYENVGSHQYPAVYISCASNDARAPAWMSLKYAARLRARRPGGLDRRAQSLVMP